jgi:rod shape-determining protein MreD
MKRIVLPLFAAILFLTLQTTLFASLPIQRLRPDFMLILTLYLGLTYPPISGGILAFLMGFLMDLFSGSSLGLFTLTRPFLFYVAQFFKDRFYMEDFSSKFFYGFIFALSEGLLILLLLNALNPGPLGHLYPLFFTFLLPQSFFTGVVTPVLFYLFDKGFSLLYIGAEWESGKGFRS